VIFSFTITTLQTFVRPDSRLLQKHMQATQKNSTS